MEGVVVGLVPLRRLQDHVHLRPQERGKSVYEGTALCDRSLGYGVAREEMLDVVPDQPAPVPPQRRRLRVPGQRRREQARQERPLLADREAERCCRSVLPTHIIPPAGAAGTGELRDPPLPPVCGREVLRVVEEDDFGREVDFVGEWGGVRVGWRGGAGEEDVPCGEEGVGEGAFGDGEGEVVVLDGGWAGGGGEDFEGEGREAVGVEVGGEGCVG